MIGFSCGIIPILIKLTPRNKRMFGIANAFSGGIFLGAALLHMIPDANDDFDNLSMPINDFPWANFITATGFVFTLFLETILSPGHEAVIATIQTGGTPADIQSTKHGKTSMSRHKSTSHKKDDQDAITLQTPLMFSQEEEDDEEHDQELEQVWLQY